MSSTSRLPGSVSRFELSFQGQAFLVPKKSVFDFFEAHPNLMSSKSCDVQSKVSIDVFREFISSLTADAGFAVTPENAASLGLLASEFCFTELAAECAKFAHDPLSALESRVANLETRVPFPPHVELLDLHGQKLDQLFSRFARLESRGTTASTLESRVAKLEARDLSPLRAERIDLHEQRLEQIFSRLSVLDSINTCASSLERRVAQLEALDLSPLRTERLDLHEQRLEQLASHFSLLQTLETTVSELSAAVSDIKASSVTRWKTDQRFQEAIARLEIARRDFQVQLERTGKSMAGLQEGMAQTTAMQKEVQREIAELKQAAGKIHGDCATANAASQKRIAELAESVRKLQSNAVEIARLDKDIAELKKAVPRSSPPSPGLSPRDSSDEPCGTPPSPSAGQSAGDSGPCPAPSPKSTTLRRGAGPGAVPVRDGRVSGHPPRRSSAISARNAPASQPPGRLFDFDAREPLDGIIAYLTAKCGGNVHDAGLVEMTSSSIEGGDSRRHHPKYVVDFGDGQHFWTLSENNPWLCFNFRERRIIPTHYTIVTDHDDFGWTAQFTMSWAVEVSTDGSAWAAIDERRDIEGANGPDRTISFPTTRSVSCQYLRIRRTTVVDLNTIRWAHHCLEMKCFEIFGRVIEPVTGPYPCSVTVRCRFDESRPLQGVIAHLTERHRGNVHEKGVVTIKSKSVYDEDDPSFALKNIADLTDRSLFLSEDEPGQWVCWDFGEKRVVLRRYALRTPCLKSWALAGSLDGSTWTPIDDRTDVDRSDSFMSFPVRRPMECRYVQLMQTDKNHYPDHQLGLIAVEFFGTLFI
jgi:hypothetical protein